MQVIRHVGALAILLSLSCGESLPNLPQTALVEPSQIEWQQLEDLQGDAIAAEAFPAGQVARLVLRVLDASLQPVAGALVSLAARADNFADLLRFPAGTQCFSDAQGLCSIVIASQGKAGALTLTARAAASVPVVAEFPMVVVARRDELKLHVEVQGVGAVEWAGEGTDPLVALERLLINADVNSGRLITVRVNDPHDNSVVGQATLLALLDQTSAAVDAGVPLPDAAVAAGDASAASPGAPFPDAAPAAGDASASLPDAATTAGDASPATPDSGAIVADGGGQADTGATTPAGAKLAIRVSASDDCSQSVAPDAPGAGISDARGNVYYCLYTTAYRGDWRALLRVPGVLDGALDPHGEQGLALDGHSAAGLPTRLAALIDGDRVLCNPGRESPLIRFRVSKDGGEGVPGVRVLFDAIGGLDGLSRRVGATNNQGEVTVKAFCPASRVQGAEVIARVVQPPLDAVHVPIEVRADAVTTLHIEADAGNPTVVHDGDELRFSVSASDANGVQVLHPVGSDEPLSLRFGIVSSGHAGTLLLGETPILAQSLAVDEEGLIDLRLTVRSRATMDQPIRLQVRTLDGTVVAEQAIAVAPGAPSQLVLQPAGRVQALVGGVGGMLNLRVLDGAEINTANGVPDVAISITAPPQVIIDRSTGNTDASGRFESMIILVTRPGDHTLIVRASQGEWSAEAELVVEGTTGLPQGINVELAGVVLVPTGEQGEQPAHEVTLRAGEELSEQLGLRLVNSQGGGIPELGLTIERIEGSEADCARWQAPGVTDEAGQVSYGAGQQTLTAGPRLARCLYRINHGNGPATVLVRVVQVPGLPLTATLEFAGGHQPPLTNTAIPSLTYASRLLLRAYDANENPAAGVRFWFEGSNCWIGGRVVDLNQLGSAYMYAATARDPIAPCRITARYAEPLEGFEPPTFSLASAGFAAPQLLSMSEGPRRFMMVEGGSQTWLLDTRSVQSDPRLLAGQPCLDFVQCSSVQVVALGAVDEQGARPVTRVLHDGLGLAKVSGNSFRLLVPHSAMGAGRRLGLRLVAARAPGAPLAFSAPLAFFAQPPFHWAGAGNGGTDGRTTVVSPAQNGGPVVLEGGHRINVDSDEALELVVCGADALGKLFAVIQPNPDGGLPASVQAQRSSLFAGTVPGGVDNSVYRPSDACQLADLNGDGHLDLVVPGRLDTGRQSAGYPNVAIHHGVGDGRFGSAHRVVWIDPDRLRNQPIKGLAISLQPPAVIACSRALAGSSLSMSCSVRFRLPLERRGEGWVEAMHDVDRLYTTNQEPLLYGWNDAAPTLMAGGPALRRDGALVSSWNSNIPVRRITRLSSPGKPVVSPDGQMLMFANGYPGELRIHNSVSGQYLRGLSVSCRATSYVLSPDGQTLAATECGNIRRWNPANGAPIPTLREDPAKTYLSLAFSPDGQTLAAGYTGGVSFWNLADDTIRHRYARGGVAARELAFSPDGQELAISQYDDRFRIDFRYSTEIIRASDGGRLRNWGQSSHNFLAYNSAGQAFFADGGAGAALHFNNYENTQPLALVILGADFSPDGVTLATVSNDPIQLINANDGSIRHELGSLGYGAGCTFYPDGQRLAASRSSSVDIYSIQAPYLPDLPTLLTYGHGSPLAGQQTPGRRWADVATFEGRHVHLQRPYTWREGCGDGVLDEGEVADPGQPWSSHEYNSSCGATCGDGLQQSGEHCDDGNDVNGDACDNTCQAP